jgi:hypothetical protein
MGGGLMKAQKFLSYKKEEKIEDQRRVIVNNYSLTLGRKREKTV